MSNTLSAIRERQALPAPGAFIAAVLSSAVVSVVLSAAVAALARAAGASHEFKALTFGAYTAFIVIGLIIGAAAWMIIRRRSVDPGRLLRRLVPAVVLVSLVPDIVVGATKSLAGSSWGAVSALMLMHLIVAACGVVAYRRFMPFPDVSRPQR